MYIRGNETGVLFTSCCTFARIGTCLVRVLAKTSKNEHHHNAASRVYHALADVFPREESTSRSSQCTNNDTPINEIQQ